jgi:hypothetical protein
MSKGGLQHARQMRKDEAAFYQYWERRQKERERLKEERNEPTTKVDNGKD